MAGEETRYWVGFHRVQRIGPVRLRRLIERFGSLEAAWSASLRELGAVLDATSAEAVVAARREIDLDKEMERIERAGARVLTMLDPEYPRLLREVPAPPPVLYVRGTLTPQDERAVAIVGTRRATSYGLDVAHQIARDLAAFGVTVVSGLALGIDGQAHRGAIAAEGRTIGVLGCGVDIVYPGSHRRLYEEMVEHGAIISDYPLGTGPAAVNFPPRNRIIAGLSLGIVVVEAPTKSGALITVDFAADYSRDVFAVPGSVLGEHSRGSHKVIRDGARLITSAADVMQDLGMAVVEPGEARQQALPMTEEEEHLMNYIRWDPQHIDEIAAAAGLTAAESAALLTMLELKGAIKDKGGQQYARV
jgi:DNA processing protein